MTRWQVLRLALIVVALAMLAVLIARLGPERVAEQLLSVGLGGVWMLVAYGAGTAVGALPWYVLLDRADRPSLAGAIASRFAASGATATVPMLGVSGEPTRLLWLSSEQRAAGVAGLILDRLSYGVASALFLCAGAIVAARSPVIPPAFAGAATAAAAVLILLAIVGAWLLARHGIAGWLHRFARRFRKRARADGLLFGEAVDRELQAMSTRHGRFALAVAIGFAARVLFAVEVYVAFWLLGQPLTWSAVLVFACVPVVLAFAGVVVPGQIGIQEGTQAFIAAALGIEPVTAVAVVLLQRMRTAILAAAGATLVAVRTRTLECRQPRGGY